MKNKLIILSMSVLMLSSCSKKLEKLMSGITGNGNIEASTNNYINILNIPFQKAGNIVIGRVWFL